MSTNYCDACSACADLGCCDELSTIFIFEKKKDKLYCFVLSLKNDLTLIYIT